MRTRRILGATALATLVAAGLAGCVKMDMQLELQSDDTVDGSMVFAVSNALAEMSGQDGASIAEQMSAESLDMDESTITSTEPYDDGEYVGQTITFEGESLDSFSGSTDGDLSIVREGDEFVVSGSMDLSETALGTEGAEGDETMASLMEGFDVQISVTFPGAVSEHNGELDGNTVTWTPKYGETTEISARGSAIEGGSSGSDLPLPLLIGIGAAVLVAAALIVLLVMRSRKNAAAAAPAVAGYAPAAFTPDAGQGYAPAPTAAPAPPVAAPPVTPAAPPAPPADAPPAPEAPPADAPPAPPQEQTPPPPPA